MHDRTAQTALTEEIARTVERVPGVAFLSPGSAGPPRAARPGGAGGARTSGVRVSRPGGDGPWQVEVHLVVSHRERTADVARAAGRAARERMAELLPGQAAAARVRVTVTGLV
ncbi:hypothetical protein [Streptomyces sp. NPDC046985]|uniref:hypothetical protein n=1 Tax=Streptomyces sp. NPDC046985 TaxID=3155377 RepID=UPI0033F7D921